MKLIHITTRQNWINIKVSGLLKRPCDLGRTGSTIHKDRIFFFLLNDKTYLQDIEVLKEQIANDKSIGDIGIGIIQYKASEMVAIELLNEVFDYKNIEKSYINERKTISNLLGYEIEYYSIKSSVDVDRLKEIMNRTI